MSHYTSNTTSIRYNIVKLVITAIDRCLTLPDILFYVWYKVIYLFTKQHKKVIINQNKQRYKKQSHGINIKKIVDDITTAIAQHYKLLFIIRLVPTLFLIVFYYIIYLICQQ